MNQETLKLIESLAIKLGTTSEYLWGVLLKQARVEAIFSGLIAILSLVSVFAFALTLFLKRDDWDGPILAICFMLSFLSVLFFILSVAFFVPAFFNPEYWALQQILGGLK
jgi:hypothetical protein